MLLQYEGSHTTFPSSVVVLAVQRSTENLHYCWTFKGMHSFLKCSESTTNREFPVELSMCFTYTGITCDESIFSFNNVTSQWGGGGGGWGEKGWVRASRRQRTPLTPRWLWQLSPWAAGSSRRGAGPAGWSRCGLGGNCWGCRSSRWWRAGARSTRTTLWTHSWGPGMSPSQTVAAETWKKICNMSSFSWKLIFFVKIVQMIGLE